MRLLSRSLDQKEGEALSNTNRSSVLINLLKPLLIFSGLKSILPIVMEILEVATSACAIINCEYGSDPHEVSCLVHLWLYLTELIFLFCGDCFEQFIMRC